MLFFLDTNIPIYTIDTRAPAKMQVAQQWVGELANRDVACLNLQVLNEICQVVLRKFPETTVRDVRKWVAELRDFGDTPITAETVEQAWLVRERFGYSWFDCLNVSAALHLGCTHFVTEDLGHDVSVFGMRIVNPFRIDLPAVLAAN